MNAHKMTQISGVDAMDTEGLDELGAGLSQLGGGEFLLNRNNQNQALFARVDANGITYILHYDLLFGRGMTQAQHDLLSQSNLNSLFPSATKVVLVDVSGNERRALAGSGVNFTNLANQSFDASAVVGKLKTYMQQVAQKSALHVELVTKASQGGFFGKTTKSPATAAATASSAPVVKQQEVDEKVEAKQSPNFKI